MENKINIRDPQTFAIIGAAMEVHSTLKFGFYERIYQDALEIEFKARGIPYIREKSIEVTYKGQKLGSSYYVDFLCYNDVIVELKAIPKLTEIEEAQVIHYLKATGYKRAILLNFSNPLLEFKRFANGFFPQNN